MAAPRRKPNPVLERLQRAQALDQRRQQQIQNQANSLTRLVAAALKGTSQEEQVEAVSAEIVTLNEQLSIAQRRVQQVEELLAEVAGDGAVLVAIDDVRRAIEVP